MTDSASPALTGGARIVRGLKRAGLVLGVLLALPAGLFVGGLMVDGVNSTWRTYEHNLCVHRAIRDNRMPSPWSSDRAAGVPVSRECASSRPSEQMISRQEYERLRTAPAVPVSYSAQIAQAIAAGLGAGGAALGAVFLAFWTLGWVLAGFSRD